VSVFEVCTDLAPADWIAYADVPWDQLVAFGPSGFAAYARVRYVGDPTGPGQDELDAPDNLHGLEDPEVTALALETLREHTASDLAYVGVWKGNGVDSLDAYGPELHVPHRDYHLYRCSLAALDVEQVAIAHPALVWPADHAWCLAADVDPHWFGVGGSRDAIAALLDHPRLDAVPADPAGPQPHYPS